MRDEVDDPLQKLKHDIKALEKSYYTFVSIHYMIHIVKLHSQLEKCIMHEDILGAAELIKMSSKRRFFS